MDRAELTCQELVELVSDYFEDALSAEERERFDAHVEECPGCRAYLNQMRVTLRLVRAADDLEQRPEVAQLLAVFRDFRRAG